MAINETQILGVIALECVARLGNYKAASEELALSIPALCQRISRLEKQLGRALTRPDDVDRRRRKLNAEGRRLVEALAPLIASLEEAKWPKR